MQFAADAVGQTRHSRVRFSFSRSSHTHTHTHTYILIANEHQPSAEARNPRRLQKENMTNTLFLCCIVIFDRTLPAFVLIDLSCLTQT